MRLYRNFFQYASDKKISAFRMDAVRGADGRVHLGMFTDFFSAAHGRVMRSNNEYNNLRNEVEACIGEFNTVDPITIDVFESRESDEFDRETSIIGFKKYIGANYFAYKKQCMSRLILFSTFLILGILAIVLLYTHGTELKDWIFYCVETIATVFLWQFAGYAAFELNGEIRQMRRYRQLTDAEFAFKKWE